MMRDGDNEYSGFLDVEGELIVWTGVDGGGESKRKKESKKSRA